MKSEMLYQKGKLYQYTGAEFVELEPSGETKLPVSSEALEAVREVRKAVHNLIKLRPELSVVASGMLLASRELPNLVELIQNYGQRVYSKVDNSVPLDDKVEQG